MNTRSLISPSISNCLAGNGWSFPTSCRIWLVAILLSFGYVEGATGNSRALRNLYNIDAPSFSQHFKACQYSRTDSWLVVDVWNLIVVEAIHPRHFCIASTLHIPGNFEVRSPDWPRARRSLTKPYSLIRRRNRLSPQPKIYPRVAEGIGSAKLCH